MKIETSDGDILDKISILELKQELIEDKNKLVNINRELNTLQESCIKLINNTKIKQLYRELKDTNRKLWEIENTIRIKEKNQEFDHQFITLARSVYFTNDKRAEIKKQINTLTQSNFVEEKSYEKY